MYQCYAIKEPYPKEEATVDAAIEQTARSEAKPTQAVKVKDWSWQDRVDWIIENFNLNQAPMLKDQKTVWLAATLLNKYFDVISVQGEYGRTDLMQHEIHTQDVPPIKCRHRPVNPALEKDLQEQLQKWLQQDIIEPSNSPWSFPLVAAPKKNGKIRWCVDYRRLNNITRKDTFPRFPILRIT